ncbi:hypothetical protein AB0C07_37920 [Actinoplanes missouriensis]|uniref:hypothetical protein n=1 Tax=Actinoplanes missouriensis TaxID=1866 RepID=UPI0034111F10
MPTRVSLDTRAEPQQSRRGSGWIVPLLVAMLVLGVGIGVLGPGTDAEPVAPAGTAAADPEAPMDLHDDEDHGGHGVGQLPTSGVVAGAGGARRGAAGFPAGFPRTQEGAAAAATVFLQALTSTGVYEPVVRRRILTAVGDPSWLSAQRAGIEAAIGAEARALGLDDKGQPPADRVVLSTIRPAWGAYRVAAFSPEAAEVVIWYYTERGVVARQGDPPQGTWRTSTLRLRWTGDWKVTALPAHRDGPVPDFAPRSAPPIFERARLLGTAWRLYANTET